MEHLSSGTRSSSHSHKFLFHCKTKFKWEKFQVIFKADFHRQNTTQTSYKKPDNRFYENNLLLGRSLRGNIGDQNKRFETTAEYNTEQSRLQSSPMKTNRSVPLTVTNLVFPSSLGQPRSTTSAQVATHCPRQAHPAATRCPPGPALPHRPLYQHWRPYSLCRGEIL